MARACKMVSFVQIVLKKQRVKYVEKVRHPGLHRQKRENPIRFAATNQPRTMLTNQIQSAVTSEERSQRLEAMMLRDPHVKYAKSLGIEDTKIRYSKIGKNYCNFSNCQELLNLVLYIEKEHKCMKCKNTEKNTVCMPCEHMMFGWTCIQGIYSC